MSVCRSPWLFVVAIAAACNNGDDVPPDTGHSGTRLKLGWYEFEDGFRTWSMDIRDSKLDALCQPVQWSDGRLRCTPQETGGGVIFSDATCTTPFLINTAFASLDSGSTCFGFPVEPARPFRWFKATSGDAVLLPNAYRYAAGTCSPASPSPGSPGFFARPATEQSPPDLVEIKYAYQGEGRLRIETMESSDGLLLPTRPYDTQYDAGCQNFDNGNFNTDGMANATSVPCELDAQETGVYGDTTCETPAVVADTSCEKPKIAVVGNAGPCRDYWSVSDETQDAVFQNFGSCTQVDSTNLVIHPTKERLEPLTLTRAKQASDGRTNLIYIGEGDTRIREHSIFFDSALDTECILTSRDADLYCMPVSLNTGTMTAFTDDACTQVVYVTWLSDTIDSDWPCMPRTRSKYSWDGDAEIRPVGAPEFGTLISSELEFEA